MLYVKVDDSFAWHDAHNVALCPLLNVGMAVENVHSLPRANRPSRHIWCDRHTHKTAHKQHNKVAHK